MTLKLNQEALAAISKSVKTEIEGGAFLVDKDGFIDTEGLGRVIAACIIAYDRHAANLPPADDVAELVEQFLEQADIEQLRGPEGDDAATWLRKAAQALTRLSRERDALRKALEEVRPYFEGEHHYDHPSCRIIRAALATPPIEKEPSDE